MQNNKSSLLVSPKFTTTKITTRRNQTPIDDRIMKSLVGEKSRQLKRAIEKLKDKKSQQARESNEFQEEPNSSDRYGNQLYHVVFVLNLW